MEPGDDEGGSGGSGGGIGSGGSGAGRGGATAGAGANTGGSAATGGGTSGTGGQTGGNGGALGTGGSQPEGGANTGGATVTGGAGGSSGTETGGASGSGGTIATGGAAGGIAGAPAGGSAGKGGATSGPPVDPALRARCTGTNPIACHFGGQPGNYEVTVVVGGTEAASTTVQAESSRTLLGAVATAAGETKRFSFVVNVREKEGQPVQSVPAGTAGLDLYFTGSGAPARLDGIGYASAPAPLMVYVAGDSTVCDQSDAAYAGWAQEIPQFFDHPVAVANYSDSGESSGSFLGNANLFGAINSRLKANDWVLIQMGHNDKETTASTFVSNMTRMVTMVKDKGAFPVLVTPIARATFNGSTLGTQHVNSTGANLPALIKQVGTAENVPVLDLTARTITWLNELGSSGWQPYFANGTDRTHPNHRGAAVIAGFVRDMIRAANITALTNRMR